MTASRVLWLGSRRPGDAGSRFLSAAGFRVEAHASLTSALPTLGLADVVVVSIAPADGPPARALAPLLGEMPEGTKVLALVSHPTDVVPALVAGANDAVAREGAGDELYVRVLAWARAARTERQQRAALHALADRAHRLEEVAAEQEREIARLRDETHRDELTGLGNRRSFSEKLAHAIDYATRYGGPVAVVLADVDGLKAINDGRGHAAGDAALRTVAEVLRASLRTTDHAARLGGDEFGLVLPATSAAAAAQVAERVRQRIETLMLPGAMRMSASFGVAALEQPIRGVGFVGDDLVARADSALYAAKRGGKNRVREDNAA